MCPKSTSKSLNSKNKIYQWSSGQQRLHSGVKLRYYWIKNFSNFVRFNPAIAFSFIPQAFMCHSRPWKFIHSEQFLVWIEMKVVEWKWKNCAHYWPFLCKLPQCSTNNLFSFILLLEILRDGEKGNFHKSPKLFMEQPFLIQTFLAWPWLT